MPSIAEFTHIISHNKPNSKYRSEKSLPGSPESNNYTFL